MGVKITVYDTDYDTGERVGKPIRILRPTASHFAWDGCHKIYLIYNEGDLAQMLTNGYDPEAGDILPVSELPDVWEQTCALRFISRADLASPSPVEQGEDADVEWDN